MSLEVTTIIPTRNRTHLLATTLRTVLWQRNVDLEVVVVDDGSSQDVSAVLASFGDARVRLIRHDKPTGVSRARNHGASEARGSWLAFCDDDDLWAPDKLASQLAAARSANRSWAYAGAIHVDGDLRVLSAAALPDPDHLVAVVSRWNVMPGGSSNVIVCAETFRRAGGWDGSLLNLADWDLWARLAREATPACVARPLVGYRVHPGNASGDTELIEREARLIDGRYGRLDYGELHHYIAWVHLRAGRRRQAVPHLVKAAAHGNAWAVGGTLVGIARRRVSDWVPAARPAPDPLRVEWMAQAEAWIAPLRQGRIVA
jgi:glycosyltransferase involved in cell wall biosynthesis